jgi:hypothetical protein
MPNSNEVKVLTVQMTPEELTQTIKRVVEETLSDYFTPKNQGLPEYISNREAGKILGCTSRHIQRYVEEGLFSEYRIGDSPRARKRYKREEVEAALYKVEYVDAEE